MAGVALETFKPARGVRLVASTAWIFFLLVSSVELSLTISQVIRTKEQLWGIPFMFGIWLFVVWLGIFILKSLPILEVSDREITASSFIFDRFVLRWSEVVRIQYVLRPNRYSRFGRSLLFRIYGKSGSIRFNSDFENVSVLIKELNERAVEYNYALVQRNFWTGMIKSVPKLPIDIAQARAVS